MPISGPYPKIKPKERLPPASCWAMEASSRRRKHPSKKLGPNQSQNRILKRKKSSNSLHSIDEALESTVIVRNLASSLTSSDELRDFFQNYGDVSHVRLVPEQSYGLVTFDAKEIAHGVIVASNSKEGIIIGNSKRKVQISWAVSNFTPETEARSSKMRKRISEAKRATKASPALPKQVKSRLFISALSSAVASTNLEMAVPTPALPPKKPLEVTFPAIPDRQVIAYDDWL